MQEPVKTTMRAWGLVWVLCGVLMAASTAAAQAQTAEGDAAGPKQGGPKTTRPQAEKPETVPRRKRAKADGPKTEVVRFATDDGVKIVADYVAPKITPGAKAPVAILIHMHPADRRAWKPLVPRLHDAGFAILAYDIRGTGESIEPKARHLQKLYKKGDTQHFNHAYRDVVAAKAWLAKRPECDVSRIALVGASIGCSIALHYASMDDAVKAIVCLSPGTDYFGVDSKAHIRACGKRAILLMSPEGEFERVQDLAAASGGAAESESWAGGHNRHGTRMFDAPYGPEILDRIVSFITGPTRKPAPKAARDTAAKTKP